MRINRKTGCLVAAIAGFVAVQAYAADPLPGAMSGRWFGNAQGGQQLNFEVFVVIEKQESDGTIVGKVTRWGNGCGAKDEPLKGTFDGTNLKFRSMSRANVNARRVDGNCGEDEYSLKRSADGKSFEGTFGEVGAMRFSVELKP